MNDRVRNTKRNIVSGILYKFLSIIFPFLIRTVIIYKLGKEFVGLSSLFTSILQVLNLAELGFSNAIVYNMYKPIADSDYKKVNKCLNYYKKVYRIIGSIILIVGLVITPWLTFFIKGSYPSTINIYIVYILYLINTAISYFLFAYKSALLNALQRVDLINKLETILIIFKYLMQLIVLIAFKNYYYYMICSIITTIALNISIEILTKKKFKQYFASGDLDENDRKGIKKQVGGLMICKVSDVSRNSFDSIIISTLFGLVMVGIYGNYYMIFSSLYGILLVITHSMQPSVGNSIATENTEKNYKNMIDFQFIYMTIVIICTTCMVGLYQPFMKIWVGESMLLNNIDMALLCAYFYLINLNNIRNIYFSGNGLWWKAKHSFILESLFNLLLNILLGSIFGITGIIVATIITILIFNFVDRTNILFKEYFKISPKEFYEKNLIYFVSTLFLCLLVYIITNLISATGILGLLIKGFICLIVDIIYLFVMSKTSEFKKAKKLFIKMLKLKRGIINE